MKMPRIEHRVSWGQIGSAITVIVALMATITGATWWLSDYLRGINDTLGNVNSTMADVLTSTRSDHATIGVMQSALALLEQRWLVIEADYAAAPLRRKEFLTKLDGIAVDLKVQMAATQDKLQSQIDKVADRTNDLARVQQQMAMDIARFKCRVFPKNCDQTP